ncbi:ulp1 protease family, C-terminal catalytic domain-containing protein [Tanacetum coccineum]
MADSLKSHQPSELDPPKDHTKNTPTSTVSFGFTTGMIKTWSKEEEILLLKEILECYRKNKKYPFEDNTQMLLFYYEWMCLSGDYLDQEVLTNKMIESPERFFNIQEAIVSGQIVVASMDRLDMEIYQLSYKIWGQEDDDNDQYMTSKKMKSRVQDIDSNTPKKYPQSSSTRTKITLVGPNDPIHSYVRQGRNQEIDLLNDMVEFYNEEGIYPYEHLFVAMHKFFVYWKKKRGINGSEDLVKEKIIELYKRFLENSNKKSPVMDQIDDTIYQLCDNLWGEK